MKVLLDSNRGDTNEWGDIIFSWFGFPLPPEATEEGGSQAGCGEVQSVFFIFNLNHLNME